MHVGAPFLSGNYFKFAKKELLKQPAPGSPYLITLIGSRQTWANYGHYYEVKLKISNPNSTSKRVRLSFGGNDIGRSTILYDGPVKISTSSGSVVRNVTIPSSMPRQELSLWTLGANSYFEATVSFYVLGLVFATGQQLLIESGF